MAQVKLTETEAANVLRVKPNTLAGWRCQRKGPPYSKVGRRVLYDLEELERYLAANAIDPEAAFPHRATANPHGC